MNFTYQVADLSVEGNYETNTKLMNTTDGTGTGNMSDKGLPREMTQWRQCDVCDRLCLSLSFCSVWKFNSPRDFAKKSTVQIASQHIHHAFVHCRFNCGFHHVALRDCVACDGILGRRRCSLSDLDVLSCPRILFVFICVGSDQFGPLFLHRASFEHSWCWSKRENYAHHGMASQHHCKSTPGKLTPKRWWLPPSLCSQNVNK